MGITPAAMRRQHWLATTTASRTLFAKVYGSDHGVTAHNHDGKRVPITFERADAVCRTPLKWSISCYAICRVPGGRDYLKGMHIQLSEPVKQDAIHKSLSHAHYDFMRAEVNMRHLLTLAWIATTGPEPSDEVAARALGALGAWSEFDYVTPVDDGGYLTNRKETVCAS